MSKRTEKLSPVHPGDVLREDFMKPLGLSSYSVAKAIGATLPSARFAVVGEVSARRWRSSSDDCSTCHQSSGWEYRLITTWRWRDLKVRNESKRPCVLCPACNGLPLDSRCPSPIQKSDGCQSCVSPVSV